MAPTPTTEFKTTLGQNSYLSLGLVLALVGGALVAGQRLERLNLSEKTLNDLSQTVERLATNVDSLTKRVERIQTCPTTTGR